MKPKAAITGGSGFAGTHLARLLQTQGKQIAIISLAGEVCTESNTLFADVSREEDSAKALRIISPAHLYHLAAMSSPSGVADQERSAFEVNVWGTRNVCHASSTLAEPPKILNVSSSQVYAPVANVAIDETVPVAASNTYAATKLMAELWCQRYSSVVEIVTARSFNHTGPGQSDQYVLPYLARCVAEIEAGLAPPIIRAGNLDVERDFTDVRDVVRAYQLLMDRGHRGHTYNVCSGKFYRLSDLLNILIYLANVNVSLEIDPARYRPDKPRIWGDHSKLSEHTGWQPAIPLEQTLRDLLSYWRNRVAVTSANTAPCDNSGTLRK